jgi:hypothetical protein
MATWRKYLRLFPCFVAQEPNFRHLFIGRVFARTTVRYGAPQIRACRPNPDQCAGFLGYEFPFYFRGFNSLRQQTWRQAGTFDFHERLEHLRL